LGTPHIARAQQSKRVGILAAVEESDPVTQGYVAAFQRRLAALGWIEDQTVSFNRRWAAGDPERMRAQIGEIPALKPDVILAQTPPLTAVLGKQAISVPIVFVQVSDPVGDGFVESLALPSGNITGFTNTMSSLGGKWVELLKEAAPGVSHLGYLINRAA